MKFSVSLVAYPNILSRNLTRLFFEKIEVFARKYKNFKKPKHVQRKQKQAETETGSSVAKSQEIIRIRMEAYDHSVLDQSAVEIVDTAKRTNSEVHGPIPLPTRIERYTVISGPHVHKKSRQQFEIRTHKRIIDVYSPNYDVLQNLRSLDISAGVDVEVKNF